VRELESLERAYGAADDALGCRVGKEDLAVAVEAENTLTRGIEDVLRLRQGDLVPAPGNDVDGAGRGDEGSMDGGPLPGSFDGVRMVEH
jgi:hypothetical protein